MTAKLHHPPEFAKKITPKEISSSDSIGLGQHLRAKFTFVLSMGVFGRGAKYPAIAQRMYATSRFDEPYFDADGKQCHREILNDASARIRLDNIMKGLDKYMIQRELDFLALCFARIFGDEAVEALNPVVLRTGTLEQVLRQLSGAQINVDWNGIDPILVLKSLAAGSSHGVEPQIILAKNHRWMDLEDGSEPASTVNETAFPIKSEFFLEIDADAVSVRPLVLNYIETREEKTADGRPVRAQILPLPIRKEDGYGNWRISKRGRPYNMGETTGRYGFCSISGAGLALEKFAAPTGKHRPLSDTDLQNIIAELLAQATTSTPALVGITTYRLIRPDEE